MTLSEYDKVALPTKRVSQILYICDLRSGHYRDLPNLSQRAKNKLSVSCISWMKLIESILIM